MAKGSRAPVDPSPDELLKHVSLLSSEHISRDRRKQRMVPPARVDLNA
ncbi:hypothetical protein SJ05684_a40450 (plasmid) [Sinorhizobium sojae CCBAU 05684]|uniref:Uncharacterized protein n=1 Tax=Sinorhizobium sojae CCBAU 05684 TaxID=716928 RepID=A0A249PN54_9HYPH|nr:hypothetical protein SJ05684_a40450 [Sinorhizobium sojae CCBAU 05684]AWI62065.1 hypothetical protein AB395_00004541 [Sinorhizobium fredii CCBAU 45436]AWM29996.1 hypothetical protein AOX55_00004562 [Sinorhizobium fredii CCBAU 25509]CEO91562.1 hypothetical protein SFHH103_psfHH103d_361 [Sinorhizobium fredii HH103]